MPLGWLFISNQAKNAHSDYKQTKIQIQLTQQNKNPTKKAETKTTKNVSHRVHGADLGKKN